ncbi:hypothetical protein Y894_13805 [Listeria monocytogenes]|nr:hypothetical protein [Listeria monocytogenes]
MNRKTSTIGKYNYSVDDYIMKENLSTETMDKFKNTDILILPYQNDDDFYFAVESINFWKYCRQKNETYSFDILSDNVKVRSINSFDIWMPIIFISSNILVPIAVNLISDYITDKRKGRENEKCQVDIAIKIQRDNEVKDIHYKGDADKIDKFFEKIDITKL